MAKLLPPAFPTTAHLSYAFAAACPSSSCSYAAPSDAPSKAASRLLFHLRHSRASLKATLRRSVVHLPKSTLLATLRHLLLEHDWQVALPMYLSLADAPWFKWNPQLHAELVALLTKFEQTLHAQSLLDGLEEKLHPKQLMDFHRALVQHYARYGLKDEVLTTFKGLQVLSHPHAMVFSLSSLLQAYASMDLPHEAHAILHDMQCQGLKPSAKDFKAVIFSFGKCGMFDDMETLACDMEKMKLLNDPVVFNMIITTYATVENHIKIKHWLDKMLALDIKPSIRSVNGIAKACRVLTRISKSNTYVRMGALLEYLKSHGATNGELEIVNDLLKFCLVQEAVKWDSFWQLDLHSAAIGSAYMMLFCWLEEVHERLKIKQTFPSEIIIVTGWGKHSEIRGSSSMKVMIRDLLVSIKSPFMVDSLNKGRLLAKPHAVVSWFSRL